MARLGFGGSTRQKLETAARQNIHHFGHAEVLHPGGGQLKRQGAAGDQAAQLGNGAGVLGRQGKGGLRAACAFHKKLDAGKVGHCCRRLRSCRRCGQAP